MQTFKGTEVTFVTWEGEVHLHIECEGTTRVHELDTDEALFLAQQLIKHARRGI